MIMQKRYSKRISVEMETISSNLITAQRFARCVRIHFYLNFYFSFLTYYHEKHI